MRKQNIATGTFPKFNDEMLGNLLNYSIQRRSHTLVYFAIINKKQSLNMKDIIIVFIVRIFRIPLSTIFFLNNFLSSNVVSMKKFYLYLSLTDYLLNKDNKIVKIENKGTTNGNKGKILTLFKGYITEDREGLFELMKKGSIAINSVEKNILDKNKTLDGGTMKTGHNLGKASKIKHPAAYLEVEGQRAMMIASHRVPQYLEKFKFERPNVLEDGKGVNPGTSIQKTTIKESTLPEGAIEREEIKIKMLKNKQIMELIKNGDIRFDQKNEDGSQAFEIITKQENIILDICKQLNVKDEHTYTLIKDILNQQSLRELFVISKSYSQLDIHLYAVLFK